MSKIFKVLTLSLLVLMSSMATQAQELPAVDKQKVQERLSKVNPSLRMKSRANSLQTERSPKLNKKAAFGVKKEAGVSGPRVEGHQLWNAYENYNKWWSFNTETAESTELWGNNYFGYEPNTGFVRDGVVYAVAGEDGFILTFDLATGEYTGHISLGLEFDRWICQATYDQVNDVVYCYTYDYEGNGFLFQTYDPETNEFGMIREEIGVGTLQQDPLVAMAYNPIDKYIYGLTVYNENWIKINPQNGEWEVIKKFDFSPAGYVQAMTYVPSAFSISYIGIDTEEQTWHVVVDPATGNITSKTRMYDEAEYSILWCGDEAVVKGAPAAPEILSAEFDPVSLSGTVKVGVPSKTADNADLTGTLQMVASIDGVEYTSQEVTPGSEVEIAIANQAEGSHKLSVYCTVATGEKGLATEYEFWIGYDSPKTPENVVLTENMVTWDLVTESRYGQQMESDVITYNVYLQGEKVNEEPITTNSLELNIEFTELTSLQAEVEAVCGTKVSQRGVSNVIVAGSYALPLDLDITQDLLPLLTIVDANGDNTTWGWSSDSHALQYYYSSSNPGDDWAIIPKANFTESKRIYSISIDVSCYSRYPERVEVGISKTGKVEDMVIVVPSTAVASDSPITISGEFKLDEAGEYYVGVHAISDADCYYLNLHKVKVEMKEVPATVPQACDNIVATAAEYGVLEATVAFNMPTLSLNNEALDIEKDIIVNLISTVDTVAVTGKPGALVSGVVKTEQGTNVIRLLSENEFGYGLETTVSVYTGVDLPRPAVLTSEKVSADNRTVTFSWETSTVGQNGGFVDPAFVTYQVLLYYPANDYWFLEANCDGTEYSYTVEENTPLEMVSLAVASKNAAGYVEEGPMIICSLGTPNEIPMLELFENQELKYAPLTIEHPTEDCSGSWEITNPSSHVVGATNETASALRAFATKDGNTFGQIALPKFNPQNDQDVMVRVRSYVYEAMPNAEVIVRGYDGSYTLGTITAEGKEDGWFEFEFPLPAEVKELQWAELVIRPSFTAETGSMLIDMYEVTVYTGIESIIETETVIYSDGNAIVVDNVNIGDEVYVFTPNGMTIVAEKATKNQMRFEVNTGIYVVRCGNKIQKVNVK